MWLLCSCVCALSLPLHPSEYEGFPPRSTCCWDLFSIRCVSSDTNYAHVVLAIESEGEGIRELLRVVIVCFLWPTERRRQGRFQPFRRLFGKKRRREAKGRFDGADVKTSFSAGLECNGVVSDDEEATQNLRSVVWTKAFHHFMLSFGIYTGSALSFYSASRCFRCGKG